MARLSSIPRRVLNRLRYYEKTLVERFRLWQASRVLSGRPLVTLGDDQCCAVVLLKNGTYFLPELLRHHRAIGVAHFVVIDTGSTDGSQALLAGEADVTVIDSRLPVARYEVLMRALLPRRHVRGGWLLIVDTDEMFDPPPGCGGRIGPLLRYLGAQGHTALLAHCLDMFSDAPVSVSKGWSYAEALQRLTQYSLGALEPVAYHTPEFELHHFVKDNPTDGPQHFWRGGMRREVFGETPLLTRHNIIRNAPDIDVPRHVHGISGVSVSDVTASFRHYKFTGDYVARDRNQVAARVWNHGEDARRLKMYDEAGDFVIRSATQQTYRGVEALLDEGFIKTSERFQAFVKADRA